MAIAFSSSARRCASDGGFRFGGGQFGFGASHIQFVADAAFKAAADQSHLFSAQAHRARDGRDFSVERAEREIILRDIAPAV